MAYSTLASVLNKRALLLVFGVLMIAANLRAPITALGPLLNSLRSHFHLSASGGGLLMTLPLLAFAVVSPFAAALAQRFGLERTLFWSLLLLLLGTLIRSSGPAWALFLGTGLIGCGIAVANVLIPSLIKRDFPSKIAMMTSLYALTLGFAAALSAAFAVPLSDIGAGWIGLSWSFALDVWALLALAAAAVWLPQFRNATRPTQTISDVQQGDALWLSSLAWQVSLFFGLVCLVYYITISWWPTILRTMGYTAASAGSLTGLLQFAALPGLFALSAMRKLKDQRLPAFVSSMIVVVGFIGVIVRPEWALMWSVICGLGMGVSTVLALAFFSLRAATAHQSARLSGMAQSLGYLLAAAGPVLAGTLHDRVGEWSTVLSICAIASAIQAVVGLYAGRAAHVSARRP